MNRLSRWSRIKRGEILDIKTIDIETLDIKTPDTKSPVPTHPSGQPSFASVDNIDENKDDFLEGDSCGEQALEEASIPLESDAAPAGDDDCLDDSLPEPESLAPGSDFSVYLQQGVSQGLRRRGLRRLFATGGYNVRDGLNDYDQDFRQQKPLSAEIAARLRQWTQTLEEAPEQPESVSSLAEQPVVENGEIENNEQDTTTEVEEKEVEEKIAKSSAPVTFQTTHDASDESEVG